jgi:hypothetical protein
MRYRRYNRRTRKRVLQLGRRQEKRNRGARLERWRRLYGPTASPERAAYERERKRKWYLNRKEKQNAIQNNQV